MVSSYYGKEPLYYTNIQNPHGQLDSDYNDYMNLLRKGVKEQKIINKARLDAIENPDFNSEIERQRRIYDTVMPPPNREPDEYQSGRLSKGWIDELAKPKPPRWGDKGGSDPLPPMKQDIYYNNQINHQNKLTTGIVNNKRAGTSEHKNGEILFDKINDGARDPTIRYPVYGRLTWKSVNNPTVVLPMIPASRVQTSSAWRSDQKVPHLHTIEYLAPSQDRVNGTTEKLIPSVTLKNIDNQIVISNIAGRKDYIEKPAFRNTLLKLPEENAYNLTNKDTRAVGYAPENRDVTDFNLNHNKVQLDERLSLKTDFSHLKHVGPQEVPVHLTDDANFAPDPVNTFSVVKEQALHAPMHFKPNSATDTAVFDKGGNLGRRTESTTDQFISERLPEHRINTNMADKMRTVASGPQGVYATKGDDMREKVTSNRTNIHIDTSMLAKREPFQNAAPVQERPVSNEPLRFVAGSTVQPIRVHGEVRYQNLNEPANQPAFELRDGEITLQDRTVGKNLGASVVQNTKRVVVDPENVVNKRKNIVIDTSTYGLKIAGP
jgi:hypothetical protein